MAIKKKYICPECGLSFTSRKLAKEHKAKLKHKGAVTVEEVIEEPKKVQSKLLPAVSTKKLSSKEQKMESAWVSYKVFIEKGEKEKDAISKTAIALKEKEGKVKGWIGTMKGRERKGEKGSKTKTTKKEPEPEPEPEPEKEIKMWSRVADKDWELIKNELPEGVYYTPNPENGNHIIQYTNFNQIAFDYLLFKYDFVEIEMENSDVIFILSQTDLNDVAWVKDMATLEFMAVGDVGENGCLEVSPEWDMLTISQVIGRLSTLPPNKLACGGGIWDKMAVAKTTSETTTSSTTGKEVSGGDYDYYWYSAEEERGYRSGFGGNLLGGRTYTKYTPPKPKPKIPQYHPIYKISEEYIFIDRIVDYSIYNTE